MVAEERAHAPLRAEAEAAARTLAEGAIPVRLAAEEATSVVGEEKV